MSDALLDIHGLTAGYGSVEVLHGVSLSIQRREIFSIVGANGAGKSTLLNAVSGFVAARAGSIRLNGQDLAELKPAAIARAGLRHVPEGRRVFAEMTVAENLELGGYGQPRETVLRRLEDIYKLFPRLIERRHQAAGTMSGGEQQMLAIGRALAADPKVLMLDEPSMGLAPLVAAEIFRLIRRLRDDLGIGVLLVEQNAKAALRTADRACVLALGKVTMKGSGAELLKDQSVVEAFLGGHNEMRVG
jgi:branched-chain amino acid transport system ATP-binding protein